MEQDTNLYSDAGEFDGHCGINLENQNQWLYHGIDNTHSHSVSEALM